MGVEYTRRQFVTRVGIGSLLLAFALTHSDESDKARKLFDVKGWDLHLRPGLRSPSTATVVAGEGEVLTPQGDSTIMRNFPEDIGSPVISLLPPFNKSEAPQLFYERNGRVRAYDIGLPAFRYGESTAGTPAIVSFVDLKGHEEKRQVLEDMLSGVFVPFGNHEFSHAGFFTMNVVPEGHTTETVETGPYGSTVLLPQNRITEPRFLFEAEVDTFAAAAYDLYFHHLSNLTDPKSAYLAGEALDIWFRSGIGDEVVESRLRDEGVLPENTIWRTLVKNTYVSLNPKDEVNPYFVARKFDKAGVLASALTIMRYYPTELLANFQMSTEEDKRSIKNIFTAALEVLEGFHKSGAFLLDQPASIDHWQSLLPRVLDIRDEMSLPVELK